MQRLIDAVVVIIAVIIPALLFEFFPKIHSTLSPISTDENRGILGKRDDCGMNKA
jgi:hypothetical protein